MLKTLSETVCMVSCATAQGLDSVLYPSWVLLVLSVLGSPVITTPAKAILQPLPSCTSGSERGTVWARGQTEGSAGRGEGRRGGGEGGGGGGECYSSACSIPGRWSRCSESLLQQASRLGPHSVCHLILIAREPAKYLRYVHHAQQTYTYIIWLHKELRPQLHAGYNCVHMYVLSQLAINLTADHT